MLGRCYVPMHLEAIRLNVKENVHRPVSNTFTAQVSLQRRGRRQTCLFFYTRIILPVRVASVIKFQQYEMLLSYWAARNSTYLTLLNTLYSEGLFQNNFLQLNIQFNNNKYTIQKDVAAFSLDAFGAHAGGVLSLWMGVTIMLVFEILEFILNLLCGCYQTIPNKETAALEEVEIRL